MAIVLPFTAAKRREPAPPVCADPNYKWLQGAVVAWMRAERAGKPESERWAAMRAAKAAHTPGEAEILKLLRRIDRRLKEIQEVCHG